MKKLTLFLNRYSSWMTLLGFMALYALFAFVLLANAEKKINELAGKEVGVIDLQFGFNPNKTMQMVADYGDAGRAYYKQAEILLDTPYPIIYAMLFAIIITMIYRSLLRGPVNYINLVPFFALLFDYLENITIISMLSYYPEESGLIATFCEIFKLIKFLFFILILVIIVNGLIRLLLQKFKSR